jgi:hypothetical protein
MAAPAKKKAPVGLMIAIGDEDKGPHSDRGGSLMDDEETDEGEEDTADTFPPGFDAAADEFLDDTLSADERKAALHRAILSCDRSYDEEG